jgi:NTE family protein
MDGTASLRSPSLSLASAGDPDTPWRPAGCDRLALVLQGGGALGAYQAGVYEALHEAGLQPDWVAGVSIGSVNAAIIAGNKPERRIARLREFWETITARPVWFFDRDGDEARRRRNIWSSMQTLMAGVPGLFGVNLPGPWLSPRGGRQATAFYDSEPLRETLTRLVDFERLNGGGTRFAAGAVNIATGNFAYFDNATIRITPEHIMASGALPPGLPMVRIGNDWFWDGGLVSNTPLQHLLDNIGACNTIVIQVDLFSARGSVPRDMPEVLARQKDIQYSSRTRLTTDYFLRLHRQKMATREILARMPEAALTEADRVLRDELATLPALTILHLIYQQAAYEGEAKDYEFSAISMREHWEAGRRDTLRTLRRREWLRLPTEDRGVIVHDIHRGDD